MNFLLKHHKVTGLVSALIVVFYPFYVAYCYGSTTLDASTATMTFVALISSFATFIHFEGLQRKRISSGKIVVLSEQAIEGLKDFQRYLESPNQEKTMNLLFSFSMNCLTALKGTDYRIILRTDEGEEDITHYLLGMKKDYSEGEEWRCSE